MVQLVVFDLDDTLYDYKTNNIKALKKVAIYVKEKFGISEKLFKKLFEEVRYEIKIQLGENSASSHNRIIYFKSFLQKIGQNPFVYSQILYDLYWNTIFENMKLRKDALSLFKMLKQKGIKIAICTNLTTNIQIKKINKLNIGCYVDYLITSEEIGVEKPNKLIFQNILNYFNIKPENSIYIGDDYKCDIIGANAVGMKSILLSDEIRNDCISIKNFKEIIESLFKNQII